MGDRYDRDLMDRRRRFGGMKIPEPILRWGLGSPVGIGHNNGPPLDDEPGYLLRRHYWNKAYKVAWKTPPMAILQFRVARAEAAGVSYRDYVSTLLDTGRYLQRSHCVPATTETIAPATRLRAALAECAAALKIAGNARVQDVGSRLLAAYSAPSRHYHDANHIAALLALLDEQAGSIGDRTTLQLAILFHDVVYDATRADNEEQSARWAEQDLSGLGVAPSIVARVSELIMATKHGSAQPAATDNAQTLLVDLDLSVLAAEPSAYNAYAAAIRREYAHVPEDAYTAGRSKVLEHFLGLPQLYATPWLHLRWEHRARRNLRRELTELQTRPR